MILTEVSNCTRSSPCWISQFASCTYFKLVTSLAIGQQSRQPASLQRNLSYTPWVAMLIHIYRPQRSCGQGNIFTPVCHSVHRGGLPQCMLGYPPWSRHCPPRSRHQNPPQSRHQTPPGADTRSPPEQTPPWSNHPPEHLPWEQTPPLEADSGIRSTSGRYASYLNAFLLY